jgi:ring-1,2-phenylacetyl-CoA epoxidase subunit PaaE
MTLLEAGLRAGLPLPYACKRGVCASCLGRSLGGRTLLANDWALLDFERKAGKLLLCQTYPASGDVEVQVGD